MAIAQLFAAWQLTGTLIGVRSIKCAAGVYRNRSRKLDLSCSSARKTWFPVDLQALSSRLTINPAVLRLHGVLSFTFRTRGA